MDNQCGTFASLHVSDLMTARVIRVSEKEIMARAATTLAQARITGAPVVDDEGRLVGVLSVTDFVHSGSGERASAADTDLVERHMTSPAISVTPETELSEAALLMCQKHIHRLPVVDQEGRPIGLVSSLDIVASVVQPAMSNSL